MSTDMELPSLKSLSPPKNCKTRRADFPADIEGNLAYKEALEQYTYNLETEIAKLYGIQGILATFTVIIFLLILVGSIAIIAGHQICLP